MNDRDMVARPPRPQGQGSLLLGVACAWGMLIGGYALAIALLNIGTGNGNDGAIVLLLALPWLGMLGLIVGTPLVTLVTVPVTVVLLLLLTFFGLLVVTATPVHQVVPRLRALYRRLTGQHDGRRGR